MVLGYFNVAVLISFAGFLFSMLGIALAMNSRLEGALIALIVAGIMDLFDGFVARKLPLTIEEKRFGVELDSLLDSFSFLFSPSLLLWFSGWNSLMDGILLVLYNMAGILRLAYFNSTVKEEPKKVAFYQGLPVTFAALFIPLFFMLKYIVPELPFVWTIRIVFALLTVLYVLKIPIPKPGGIFYVIFPVLAAILIVFYAIQWIL